MESIEKILNRYGVKLVSVAFIIFGMVVLLDILIIKNELLKIVIVFLFIVGVLYIVTDFSIYIKEKFENFMSNKKEEKVLIESMKSLKKEEMRFIYEAFKNNQNRFNFYEISTLIDCGFFEMKKDLGEDVIVELHPTVRKYLKGKV